jgi:hypothetical protein
MNSTSPQIQILGHSQKTLFQQFNIANFSLPQEGIRGNSGLGTVRGPGQENVDLSLAKTFPIYDRCHGSSARMLSMR